jgi:hypothetical protein
VATIDGEVEKLLLENASSPNLLEHYEFEQKVTKVLKKLVQKELLILKRGEINN